MTLDRLVDLMAAADLERLVRVTGDRDYYRATARLVLDDLAVCHDASEVARVLRYMSDALFSDPNRPRRTPLRRYAELARAIWAECSAVEVRHEPRRPRLTLNGAPTPETRAACEQMAALALEAAGRGEI